MRSLHPAVDESKLERRRFIRASFAALGAAALGRNARLFASPRPKRGEKLRFGLVTYLWGKDWDLPALIANCERARLSSVELRTTHRHGVEPSLGEREREDVRKRFEDSSVELVGLGSNERFDHVDPDALAKAIEATQAFVRLSHDVGGSGVKVKPDRFHDDVPRERTIAQIGKALHTLGEYADGFGQEIRLEVHGGCAELPVIRAILDAADHDRVKVCWNSNKEDLAGKGLEHNFELVRADFGRTLHVHELHDRGYPYERLLDILVETDWDGYVLLEASSTPKDRVAALDEQREIFEGLVALAQARRG